MCTHQVMKSTCQQKQDRNFDANVKSETRLMSVILLFVNPKYRRSLSRAASYSYSRETTLSQTVLFFSVIFPLSDISLWQVFICYINDSRGVLLMFKQYCLSIDQYFVFSTQKKDFSNNMTGRKNAWTVSTYRCPIQSLRKLF